ncbi:response regulator [Cereibacter changlensis]|uniref:response regulator n=1 Tax=Cereibacter changlensis TaxID=402884 RepID=UPI004033C1F5
MEDEFLIGLDLACTLEDAGFETVGIAKDMYVALEMAAGGRVDLATMDVQLARGTNGIDTALRLWEDHAIPSVFVSASIDAETRERASDACPVGFINKPMDPVLVVAFVKAHFAA